MLQNMRLAHSDSTFSKCCAEITDVPQLESSLPCGAAGTHRDTLGSIHACGSHFFLSFIFIFIFFLNEKLNTENDAYDIVGGIPTGKMQQAGWISPQNPNRSGIHTC